MLAKSRAKRKPRASARGPASDEPSREQEAQIFNLFRQVDTNGDGTISQEELTTILVACDLPESKARKAFRIADVSRDGIIDYGEFLAWVFKKEAPEKLLQRVGELATASDGSECGHLYTRRPKFVLDASATFFQKQATAAKDKAYGAVGSPDYVIEMRTDSFEKRALMGVWDLVNSFEDPSSLRILDLGTGDGHVLYGLHMRFGIPWSNLVGVSAEDMRGLGFPVADGVPVLDLRDVPASHNSYIVWNIDDLHNCKAIQGRTFDIVISFVTFCWLTDPFGALEVIHDRFLATGGLFLCSSLQLQVVDVGAIDDQLYLAALRDYLCGEGHDVNILRDPTSGFNSVWFQRKVRDCLNLWPALSHGKILEGSSKVAYVVKLPPGRELEEFDTHLLTTLKLGPRHGLTCQACQLAEACFRMMSADGLHAILSTDIMKLCEDLFEALPLEVRDAEVKLSFQDWMHLVSVTAEGKGLRVLEDLCKRSLAKLAQAKAQRDQALEFARAEMELYYGHPAYQSGPLWDIKCCSAKAPSEMQVMLPLWQAVFNLIGYDTPKSVSSDEVRKCIGDIRQLKDGLRLLAETRGTEEFLNRWHYDLDAMRTTLIDIEKLMSSEETALAFDPRLYKPRDEDWKVSIFRQSGEFLCIWLREIVKEMRGRASCFVATITVIDAMVNCTSIAGDAIIPLLPVDMLTLGDVKAAICKAVGQDHVKLISIDGVALDVKDTSLVEDALRAPD